MTDAEPAGAPPDEALPGEPEELSAERLASLLAQDRTWMGEALAMAEKGLAIGELPIGAVVVADGEVVGRAFTQEATQGRLLVHAELLALDQADRVVGARRGRAILYTTLEPCLMCLGAAATAMVERVVFGLGSAADGAGELAGLWDAHRRGGDLPHVRLPPVIGGVGEAASRDLFTRFIAGRPGPTDPLARWASTLVPPAAPALAPLPDPA
ncbi:hypothetical protein BH10ACT1_BH10ACT1_19610 [soil metagenome]